MVISPQGKKGAPTKRTHPRRGYWSRSHGWRTCWPAGPACCRSQHDQRVGRHVHPLPNTRSNESKS